MESQGSFEIENVLNTSDNLPFGYFSPESDGKVYWVCSMDKEDQIVSTFGFDEVGNKDRRVNILKSMDEALHIRSELIKGGWLPLKAPEIKTKVGGEERGLTRKEKRALERKLTSHIKKMESLEGK